MSCSTQPPSTPTPWTPTSMRRDGRRRTLDRHSLRIPARARRRDPGRALRPAQRAGVAVDPASGHSDPSLGDRLDRLVILVCDEGYQSSRAAATLEDLGFPRATDLVGGFQAWRTAGLSVDPYRPT